MKRSLLLALPLALMALAGCGSSSSSSTANATSAASSPTSAASPSSSSLRVMMKNLAFSPASIQAKVGQTVKWTNQDIPPHNVVYVSGPKFASSGNLSRGGQFKLKLTQAGTIHYICSIHPFMKATIVVTR